MSISRIINKISNGVCKEKEVFSVRLKRFIGTEEIERLDPFLLLDEFKSNESKDYKGGFPRHPHRGFQTCTIMLDGSMEHEDNKGNKGVISNGSVQWMSAGKGIIHSEIPKQENGLLHGLQLWINLPAKNKMDDPSYQDITSESIPCYSENGNRIRVIAGKFKDLEGPLKGITVNPTLLDIHLTPNSKFSSKIPFDHSSYVFVYKGSANFGPENDKKMVSESQIAILDSNNQFIYDKVDVETASDQDARFILVSALPISEPVIQYRQLFVMNTEQEIKQAIKDYHTNKF